MIIKLVALDGTPTHFDMPNKCGYAPERVTWNHEIYTLVSAAIDPLPTYHRLPPIPKIDARWHCQPPETPAP